MKLLEKTELQRSQLASFDEILKAAGADLWPQEAIEAHKAHELAKAPPPSWLGKRKDKIGRLVMDLGEFASLAAFVSFILTLVSFTLYMFGVPFAGIATVSMLSLMVASGVLFFLLVEIGNMKVRPEAKWECHSVTPWYPVPTEVRHLMNEVKGFLPHCTFKVDELQQGMVSLDPVLYVSVAEAGSSDVQTRAIFVWDKDGKRIPPPG